MTDDALEEGWQRSEWIYIGRRWSPTKRKLFHVFLPADLDDDGTDSSATAWYSKPPPQGFVGAVFLVEHNGDGTARITSAEYIRSLVSSDDDRVPGWALEDRAARDAQETERARKRMKAEAGDFGDLTLREVRDIAARQPRHVRLGTGSAVLDYVIGGW